MLNSTLEKLLKECTVRIRLENGAGTGFFVAPQLLLTCAHVVSDSNSDEVGVIWDGYEAELSAEIEVIFKALDLALLRLTQDTLEHPCIWLDQQVQIGDACYSYGYPQDYLHGDSSSFEYEGQSRTERSWLLKLKAGQANYGASGSPVLNIRTGGVIGLMNLSRNPGTDLGARAVPTEVILKRFPELIELQASIHQPGSVWLDLVIEIREEAERRKVGEELLVLLRKMDSKSETRVSASLITVPPKVEHWQGRNSEVATISGWLSDPLITLIGIQGVGGVGKSALGAKLFHEVDVLDFGFEGKFWADVSQKPDFSVFAEQVLRHLGKQEDSEMVGVDNSQVINELLNCLNETRYLVVVDNLETLLQDDRQWQDTGYEEFFRRWQQLGHTSTILITTQEKPILSERVVSWIILQGLGIEVGVALLQSLGIQGEFSELCEFVESMDSHPLTLKLIAGFLQEYCQGQLVEAKNLGLKKFEQIAEEALGNSDNNSEVRHLWILQQHFERLDESLQQLLVDLTVYRQAFDVHAAAAVYISEDGSTDSSTDSSTEISSNLLEVQRSLRELVNRSLLIELTGNTYQFQPFVASYLSHQNLDGKINAHERAIHYWESQSTDPSEWKSLQDLKPWLEIFHHQMELGLWMQALETLYPCCEFLVKGCHSTLLIELAEPCLKQIDIQEETSVTINEKICEIYSFVAVSLNRVSQFQKSLEYSELNKSMAQTFGNEALEATALSAMGNSYFLMGMVRESLDAYEKSLEISVKINELYLRVESTLGLVEVYWELAQYQKSLALAKEAWSLLEKEEFTPLKSESLLTLGVIQHDLDLSQAAFEKICQALEIARLKKYRYLECKALRKIGQIRNKKYAQQEPTQLLQQSLGIAQEVRDPYQEASSLAVLNIIDNSLKSNYNSLVGLESALELSKAISADLLMVKILMSLGRQKIAGQQPEIALEYFSDALATAERLNYGCQLQAITTEKIQIFYDSQDYEQVLVHANQVLQGLPDGENSLLKYSALWMKGAAEFETGKTEAGIANILAALETAKMFEDPRTEGRILGSLSYCYEKTQQYDRVQAIMEQRLALAKQTGILVEQADVLGQSGAFYAQTGDYQQAISLYQDWLQLAQAADDRKQKELALLNLGICHSYLGQHETAIEYFEKQIALAIEDEELSIYADGLNRLADSYFKLNNFDKAQEQYTKAEELLDELQEQDLIKLATMKGLGLVAKNKQNYDLAISYLQNSLNLATILENQQEQWILLTEIGASYYYLENYTEALRLFQQAWSLAETMSDGQNNLASTKNLAITYRNLSDFEQATIFREKQLQFAKVQNNSWNLGDALASLGGYAFDQKRYRKAIEYYGQTLPIAQDFQDQDWQSRLLKALGDSYRNLSQYSRAIECYREGLDIAQSLKDRRDLAREARILGAMGQSYRDLYQYSTAIKTYRCQLDLVQEIEDRPAEIKVFNALGDCYSSLSQYQRAIDYYEQSLTIAREIGDRVGEQSALSGLGYCYRSLSQYQRAIDYHEQSLAIAREIGDRYGERPALSGLGSCYSSLSQYQRAIDYHEQSLAIAREIGDRYGERYGLSGLGSCYSSLSQYQRAIDYYEQSLAIAREIGDRYGERYGLSGLGDCYRSLSQYQRAIDYYEQSLTIARAIGSRLGERPALSGLGSCYRSLSQYQRAIDYYEQSLAIAREIGDRVGESYALSGLGSCYSSLSQYQRAIDYYEQSLAIDRAIGDRSSEGFELGKIGHANYSLKENQKALEYLQQSLAIGEDVGDLVMTAYYGCLCQARVLMALNRGKEAKSLLIRSYKIFRAIGTEHWLSQVWTELDKLGQSFASAKEFSDAAALHEEKFNLLQELGTMTDQEAAIWVLRDWGKTHFEEQRYELAIEVHQKMLDLAQELDDDTGISMALAWLGCDYRDNDKLDEALRCFEQRLDIAERVSDRNAQRETLGWMTDLYKKLNRTEDTLQCYEKRLAVLRGLSDQAGERSLLYSFGSDLLYKLKQYEEAEKRFLEALELAAELDDSQSIANTFYMLGTVCEKQEKLQEAIDNYSKAYQKYTELYRKDDSSEWAKKWAINSMIRSTELHEKVFNHEEAINCYQQHISLISGGEEASMATQLPLYLAMGRQYLKIDKLSEALEAFQLALGLAEQQQKLSEIADVNYEIGSVQQQLQKLDEALHHYQISLEIDIKDDKQERVIKTYKAIGDIYKQRQAYAESIEQYEQRLILSRQAEDKVVEQSCLEDLGSVFKQMDDRQKSLEYFKSALNLARDLEDRLKSANLLYILGTLYQDLDDDNSAIGAFTQAYALYSEAGEADQVAATREQLRDLGSLF